MAGKKSWLIRIVIFVSVAVLAGFYYYGTVKVDSKKVPSSYSLILYQNTNSEWETLLQGVWQAQEDFGVKMNVITMETDSTAQEQEELIRREISAGTKGILLAAVSSREIGTFLGMEKLSVPVVTVETGTVAQGGTVVNISADNYRMGQLLGEKILEDMTAEENGSKDVLIIKEYTERESVEERYKGLTDTLKNSSQEVHLTDIARTPGDFDLSLFIGVSMKENGEYVAALDKYSTQEASRALQRKMTLAGEGKNMPKIYGIGSTAQIVNDLDNGYLKALVYQNEFNMGYEGIKALVEMEKKGYFAEQPEITPLLVTRENLYDSVNERLLFPNN